MHIEGVGESIPGSADISVVIGFPEGEDGLGIPRVVHGEARRIHDRIRRLDGSHHGGAVGNYPGRIGGRCGGSAIAGGEESHYG